MWAQQDLAGRVVALLQGSPAVAEQVTRRVTRPTAGTIDTAVRVRIGPMRGEQLFLAPDSAVDWQLSIVCECMARAATNQAPDEAVGPVVSAVHARLLSDTTLRAAGFELQPEFQIDPDQEETDERIGAAAHVFTFRWVGAFASLQTA